MRKFRAFVLSSVVVLCAFAVATFGGVSALADVPPTSPPVTLTLHFSSVDGEDLIAPIIIRDITPGTTIGEAVYEGTDEEKDFWDDLFELEPFDDSLHRTYEPLSAYSNWTELDDASIYSDEPLYADADVYVIMFKYLHEATINVSAPTCGTETSTPEIATDLWEMSEQTNVPAFNTGDNKYYHAVSSNWLAEQGQEKPLIGTFVGGETYLARYTLEENKFGSFFTYGAHDWFSGLVTVNGEGATLIDARRNYDGNLDILVRITAVHDWDEGTVTKEPTTKAEGERTFKCKHFATCGGVKTEPIARLESESKSESKSKSEKQSKRATTPKTSDGFDPRLCVALAACSIAAFGGAVAIRKMG